MYYWTRGIISIMQNEKNTKKNKPQQQMYRVSLYCILPPV